MGGITLVIDGPPRTKKNHTRRVYSFALKRTVQRQSEAQEKWAESAIWQLRNQWRMPPIVYQVTVRAVVYRQTNTGDLVGYLQAIGDVLQSAKVLVDDKLIASWDGSRLDKDAARPRVEVEIAPLGAV